MLSFGVSNLRRLKFVPPIRLKPITILVGRNSSGKSSFLRAFPLLRQSIMTRTSSPILWYGELIDFGSFDISRSDHAFDEPITFSFVLDTITSTPRRFYWHPARDLPIYSGVHFGVSIVAAGERTRISRIHLRVDNPQVEYDILIGEDFKVQQLLLNGRVTTEVISDVSLQITPGTVLPEMSVVVQSGEAEKVARPEFEFYQSKDPFVQPLKKFIKGYTKGKLSDRALESLSDDLIELGLPDNQRILGSLGRSGPKPWQSFIRDACVNERSTAYAGLHQLLSVASLPNLLASIRLELRSVITSTLYIGPARARSERYYRYQDLAVSEIDPDGKNFPMFLNSLQPYQIHQLSRWIEGLFGYGLDIDRQSAGGHMSINLVVRGIKSNIVDTGYGVSQILPVLGQIWWARNKIVREPNPRPRVSLLAIEQPELHLHPAHQALLADALVGEVAEKGGSNQPGINFLIETHSETMLNRLGELISLGRISSEDVQVVLFEALEDDEDGRVTDVRIANFNESGELLDWPYGFFQPVVF
nr:AAA family ATPase [Bradyrhizobium sp. SZCCHNR1023]